MISKHLQKDLERQMIRVRALTSHRIKRVKASRPKNNFQIIKQMNNNTMHISANTKGHLLLLIEQSKNDYRKKLGSKGACRHADPENLSIAFGIHTINIELTYSEVTSLTGFPFNRLICKLRLDGAAISLKQLKEELNND
jgi:hypothetical protein